MPVKERGVWHSVRHIKLVLYLNRQLHKHWTTACNLFNWTLCSKTRVKYVFYVFVQALTNIISTPPVCRSIGNVMKRVTKAQYITSSAYTSQLEPASPSRIFTTFFTSLCTHKVSIIHKLIVRKLTK